MPLARELLTITLASKNGPLGAHDVHRFERGRARRCLRSDTDVPHATTTDGKCTEGG